MATLKLTIFKAKVLKNGKHKIRIALCHKGETCYILTRYLIDSENQFKNGLIQKRPDASMMNMHLRSLLNAYQEKLNEVQNQSMYTCRQLKDIISRNVRTSESSTFKSVSTEYIKELILDGRDKYASIIRLSEKYFCEFLHGDIALMDITPELIAGFSKFLKRNKCLSVATEGTVMRHIKVIINQGVKRRMVNYSVHPFIDYIIPASPVREIDISLEAFNRIRLATPKEKKYHVAHDLFCLSFYLGGINLIDLLQIDFRDTEVLEYVRTKTKNTAIGARTISFTIPEEAKGIIKEWMNKNTGRLDFGYKFSYPNFSRYLTRSLASLAKKLGITEKVVYYSARKSFAQYASEIGIPDGIIDYCLGHSDKSKGVIRYYTKVRQKQADMAISRVIDYVNNPEKYKEYIELRSDIMMMRG
ncbi:phage integrase SAM-like domain-containing protein [Phocaeicola coprophilus]|jgi:intergrase/recombinase|uniref:phage integrase SAM-like domain-containing protein n=1 Tax=Phocaeicola coprophilus TaxID=387090 RepID=UPI003AF16763